MKDDLPRVVFDCNVYFQALINEVGPAGKCVSSALNKEIVLVLSRFVVNEIRRTATDSILRAKFRHITDERLDKLIANIQKVGHLVTHVPERFVYLRDSDDAHYVNLALVANAKYIVSRDNDLLDLMDPARPEGRAFREQFPSLEIVAPPVLLRQLDPTRNPGRS